MIHRPDYYGILKDSHGNPLKGITELIIAKHRNGKTGDVKLRFIGEYARFANRTDDVPLPGETSNNGLIQSRMNQVAISDDDPIGTGRDVPPSDAPF
jgi:replicative DNA helicase